DYSALPHEDLLKHGLRSFARLIEVDPDQVIEDFRRERQRHTPRLVPELPKLPSRRAVAIVAVPVVAVAAAAVLGFVLWPRESMARGSTITNAASLRTPAPPSSRVASPPPTPPRPSVPPQPEPEPEAELKPEPPVAPLMHESGASIPEFGVGKGIVGHDLVGETHQFSVGDRAWFWTRIEGGVAGRMITHVWIHEGDEALRVPVKVGGSRWRAHSYKDLNARSEGDWVVEARDETGRVLARSKFVCSARSTR